MDQDRITQILNNIREAQSNEDQKKELILNHLPLVTAIARKLGRNYPRLKDDLEGVARLELVKLIDRIYTGQKEMTHDNLGRLITKTIRFRCRSFIETNARIIMMKGRTFRLKISVGINEGQESSDQLVKSDLPFVKKELIKKLPAVYQSILIEKAQGLSIEELKQKVREEIAKLLPLPKIRLAIEDFPRESPGEETVLLTIQGIPLQNIPYAVPTARREVSIEILELLQKAVQTPIEQMILKLRMEGFTYTEIAPRVGMSFTNVGNKVRGIEERYDYYDAL